MGDPADTGEDAEGSDPPVKQHAGDENLIESIHHQPHLASLRAEAASCGGLSAIKRSIVD